MMWLWYVLSGLAGYLIGCISFGYLGGKLFKGKDIRDVGSGNAGTANAIRNYGWGVGAFTFIGDVAKGVISTLIGLLICGGIMEYFAAAAPVGVHGEYGAYIGGLAAVLGHIWPVFLKFRGGKGVATSLGVFLVIMPMWAGIVFAVCIIIIALTKTMSIGSLLGMGPEWQAVQVIFSRWTGGRPACSGTGAPSLPPIALAPVAPEPRWQPLQLSDATSGSFRSIDSVSYPRTISCDIPFR